MCVGVPMKVIKAGFGFALCEGMGARREIDTRLVGDQPEGTWLMTFLDSAREVLSEDEAQKISDALHAVSLTFSGVTDIDHLFADLIDREPTLPEHLRDQTSKAEEKEGSS